MFPGGIIPGWLIPFDQAAAEAIHDYVHSHRIHENVQALCEAIILAVDYGKPIVHAYSMMKLQPECGSNVISSLVF